MVRSEAWSSKNPAAPRQVAVWSRFVLLAAAAALVCTIAALVPQSASAVAGAHADPSGDTQGPLDVTGIRFQQTGAGATLTLRTAAPVATRDLPGSGRGTMCVTFSWGTPTEPRKRLCVVGSGAKVVVNADALAPKTQKITGRDRLHIATHQGSRFVLHFQPAAVGLPVGLLHMAARTTFHVGAPCNATHAGCVDAVPTSGTFPVRVYRVVASGCQASSGQVTNGPRTQKVVALTFDDGPSIYTPAYLSILREENVHATFFQIGQQVSTYGSIDKAILAQGSAIGDHTWDHADVSRGGAFATSELSRAKTAIETATGGYVPCVFRPPYGATSSALVAAGGALGMKSILWDVDTNDWQLPGTPAIISRLVGGARPGSITLMHDGGGNRSQSQAALRPIIQQLKAKGYRFVTVPELLGLKTTYRLSTT